MNEDNLNYENHHYDLMLFLLIILICFLLQGNANYYFHQYSLINLLEYRVHYCILKCILVLSVLSVLHLVFSVLHHVLSVLYSVFYCKVHIIYLKQLSYYIIQIFSSLLNVKEALCLSNCNY